MDFDSGKYAAALFPEHGYGKNSRGNGSNVLLKSMPVVAIFAALKRL